MKKNTAILSLPGRKRKDTARIFHGSCPGVKVPPYGGRFSPGHPSCNFFGALSRSVKQRIAGCERKIRRRSKKGLESKNLFDFFDFAVKFPYNVWHLFSLCGMDAAGYAQGIGGARKTRRVCAFFAPPGAKNGAERNPAKPGFRRGAPEMRPNS
jgi:hypothetical protein